MFVDYPGHEAENGRRAGGGWPRSSGVKPCDCAPPRTTTPPHSTQACARNADSARATPTTRCAGMRAIVSSRPARRLVRGRSRKTVDVRRSRLRPSTDRGFGPDLRDADRPTGRGSRGFSTGRGRADLDGKRIFADRWRCAPRSARVLPDASARQTRAASSARERPRRVRQCAS